MSISPTSYLHHLHTFHQPHLHDIHHLQYIHDLHHHQYHYFLGTLLGNLFLGTLLGNLFLGTLLGNPFLGTWEPCGILGADLLWDLYYGWRPQAYAVGEKSKLFFGDCFSGPVLGLVSADHHGVARTIGVVESLGDWEIGEPDLILQQVSLLFAVEIHWRFWRGCRGATEVGGVQRGSFAFGNNVKCTSHEMAVHI